MRKYNSTTDYTIVLEACRQNGACGGSIVTVAKALTVAGIHWPALQDSYGRATLEQTEMDQEIGRAWKELGYTK